MDEHWEIDSSLRITGEGTPIGNYRGEVISAWLEKDGERFYYDRIALEDADGGTPLDQLCPDEFMVAPGLIYRKASS